MNDLKVEIENLQQSFAEIKKELKTIIAEEPTNEKMTHMMEWMRRAMDNIDSRMSYVHQRINANENKLYSHCETNHVPALKASAMQKFLKVVGMEDDMEVRKPSIYCSAGRRGIVEV